MSARATTRQCHVSQLHWKTLHRERVPLLLMCSFLSLTDRRRVPILEREYTGTRGTRDFMHLCLPLPSGCHHDFLLLVHKGHGFHLCASLGFTVAHVLLTLQDVAGISGLRTLFSSHQSSDACENIWSFTLWRQREIKEHLLPSKLERQTLPC